MDDENNLSNKLKYFGPNDLATVLNADDVYKHINSFRPKTEYTVNEILALQNCLMYIDDKKFGVHLPNNEKKMLLNRSKEIRREIGRYWNGISQRNFRTSLTCVSTEFREDLIASLFSYKVNKRLTKDEILEILMSNKIPLFLMLKSAALVQELDDRLRQQIMSEEIYGAECIIEARLLGDRESTVYLPSSLSNADIDKVICQYLDCGQANYNYIRLISEADVSTGITDATKVKAKKLYMEQTENFFKEESGIQYSIKVLLNEEQEEPRVVTTNGNTMEFSFSTEYLSSHLDYESIIINFAGLFGMVEAGYILSLPSYASDISTLEGALTTYGRNDYKIGNTFMMKEGRILCTTELYDRYLESKGIRLESVVRWAFTNYFKNVFGAPSFVFTESSSNSYYEKAKNLFSEMEGAMRQVKMYFEHKKIDDELLDISSKPIMYEDVPSLNQNKYMYANQQNEEVVEVLRSLFSDQSRLCYTNNTLHEPSLSQLIIKHHVTINDFLDYQKSSIRHLIDLGILSLHDDQSVVFRDAETFFILDSLNKVEAIAYQRCSDAVKKRIDKMVDEKWLYPSNTLLTKQEASYFNYCLNRREFNNGLDLRNKYLHGTRSRSKNENEHKEAYFRGLILMIALIIKIFDDMAIHASNSVEPR